MMEQWVNGKSYPSTEKHLWKITKQIILVIKNEVLVFVKQIISNLYILADSKSKFTKYHKHTQVQ